MEVMEAIHKRHSIRVFSPETVTAEDIRRLVDAASAAPSAGNSQPWHFHVAVDGRRERINEIMAQSTVHLTEYLELLPPEQSKRVEEFYANLGNAPVVMAVSLPVLTEELDRINEYIAAGCAIENILLAATDSGLGSCNISFPRWVREQLMEAFEIDREREVVSLILIGHPAETPAAPEHREDVATILE